MREGWCKLRASQIYSANNNVYDLSQSLQFQRSEKNFNDRTAYVDSEDQIVNFNDLLKWTLGMLLEDLQKKGYVIPSRDISDYERIFGKKKNSLLRTAYMSGIEDILIGKFDYCTCRHESSKR